MDNLEEIVLYSNSCPKCVISKMKLKEKKINFSEVNNMESIMVVAKERLFSTLPFLSVGGDWFYGDDAIAKIEEM